MHDDATAVPAAEMPAGACTCEACRKLAALAAAPWTWEQDLALRPGETQKQRRG
jgi:hypothetical protein